MARFDPETGALDLDHLARLVDSRTKLVCCTGASNFLGTKPPLAADPRDRRRRAVTCSRRASAVEAAGRWGAAGPQHASSTCRRSMSTISRSPSTSCWHRSAWASSTPASSCSAQSLPFLYGGDMVAAGQGHRRTAWSTTSCPGSTPAGTPNILGVIVVGAGAAPADRSGARRRFAALRQWFAVGPRGRGGGDEPGQRPRRRPHRPRTHPHGRHRGAAHLRPAGRRRSVTVAGVHRHRHRPTGAGDRLGRGGR